MHLKLINTLNLARLRDAANMSQTAFADRLGVTQGTISASESNGVPVKRVPAYYRVFFEECGYLDPLPVLVPGKKAQKHYDPMTAFGQMHLPDALAQVAKLNDRVEGFTPVPALELRKFMNNELAPGSPYLTSCYALCAAVGVPTRAMTQDIDLTNIGAVVAELARDAGPQLVLDVIYKNEDFKAQCELHNVAIPDNYSAPVAKLYDPMENADPMRLSRSEDLIEMMGQDDFEEWSRRNCVRCYRASPEVLTQPWHSPKLGRDGYLCPDCQNHV